VIEANRAAIPLLALAFEPNMLALRAISFFYGLNALLVREIKIELDRRPIDHFPTVHSKPGNSTLKSHF
jgi:hypothetical protein